MDDIAIIGSGYSGLTLALRLQQLGVPVTLYAAEEPDVLRRGRLVNTVGRFAPSVEREQVLGIDHWPAGSDDIPELQFRAVAPLDAGYTGRFSRPMRATDFRVLLPAMLETFAARGGVVRVAADAQLDTGQLDIARLDQLSAGHGLSVVAVGSRSLDPLFPVDGQRSPYREPQRRLFGGIFEGLALPDRHGVSMNLSPLAGGVFQMPMRLAEGLGTSLLVSAIPGGPLAAAIEGDPAEDGFTTRLAAALEAHAPAIAARIDRRTFRPAGPRHWLRGAVTPTVRRAWAELPSGRPALAIGDAWITNDPLTGQGANLGSQCAWVAAEHLARGGPYDTQFGERLAAAMWEYAGPVTAFSNAFLQPPPAHVIELVLAAAAHQPVADRYVDLFANPLAMWATTASPERVRRFIDGAIATATRRAS